MTRDDVQLVRAGGETWEAPGRATRGDQGDQGMDTPESTSVTWLIYLNDDWCAERDGGALRCIPRTEEGMRINDVRVGAHGGNLQVGWVSEHGQHPVFLDCFHPSGGLALYRVATTSSPTSSSTSSSSSDDERRIILSPRDFDVPAQPIELPSSSTTRRGRRSSRSARVGPIQNTHNPAIPRARRGTGRARR